jgi:hypothetical protein
MTEAKRYFLCADLYDRAKSEGASPKRLKRLKAWEQHLAEDARRAMSSPWTVADLFATLKHSLS